MYVLVFVFVFVVVYSTRNSFECGHWINCSSGWPSGSDCFAGGCDGFALLRKKETGVKK